MLYQTLGGEWGGVFKFSGHGIFADAGQASLSDSEIADLLRFSPEQSPEFTKIAQWAAVLQTEKCM